MPRYAFALVPAALFFATAVSAQQFGLEMWRHLPDSRHFDRPGFKSELIGQGAAVEVRKGEQVLVAPEGDFKFTLRSVGHDPSLRQPELPPPGSRAPDGLIVTYSLGGAFLLNATNQPMALTGFTIQPSQGGVSVRAGFTCLLPATASVRQRLPDETIAVIVGAGSADMVRTLGSQTCGGERQLFRDRPAAAGGLSSLTTFP